MSDTGPVHGLDQTHAPGFGLHAQIKPYTALTGHYMLGLGQWSNPGSDHTLPSAQFHLLRLGLHAASACPMQKDWGPALSLSDPTYWG